MSTQVFSSCFLKFRCRHLNTKTIRNFLCYCMFKARYSMNITTQLLCLNSDTFVTVYTNAIVARQSICWPGCPLDFNSILLKINKNERTFAFTCFNRRHFHSLVVLPLQLRSQGGDHWEWEVFSVPHSTFWPLWAHHLGTHSALHFSILVSVNTFMHSKQPVQVRKYANWDTANKTTMMSPVLCDWLRIFVS